jgi:hypothetical protein
MTDCKILFLPPSSSISTGSYRIWMKDLSHYLSQIKIDSKIGSNSDVVNHDVIILGKGDHAKAKNIKEQNKKVGLINPAGGKNYNVDFIIVGSLEEKDSLSMNKNVILFPLIERLFQNKKIKDHQDKKTLKLCFHGHYPHLSKFEPFLKSALNEFSKEREIELLAIHGNPNFRWRHGKPDIKVTFKRWNIKTIYEDISSCDIGLCPNATSLPRNTLQTSTDLGLYDTDYSIRFKNKSNAGRAFVFHQLGIPVIADLTPSHFHILGNPDCGHIAMSKDGWLNALRELTCKNHRNFIATNAKKEFNRLYNPLDWAKKLYNQILKL